MTDAEEALSELDIAYVDDHEDTLSSPGKLDRKKKSMEDWLKEKYLRNQKDNAATEL